MNKMKTLGIGLILFFLSSFVCNKNQQTKSNSMTINTSNNADTITLAGGCFWCIETTLNRLKGVDTVLSGYMGGNKSNPTYEEVCTGSTGHAEVVQVYYNPEIISLETLLTVFFTMHDPTTLNRQGADIGTQYRSAIFYHHQNQKQIIDSFINKLVENKVFDQPIVTEISASSTFYKAEDYHQNYYNLNREKNSYCMAVIDPKVNKLRKSYLHLLKD